MHNYSVGSRYATKTKLGNWYEEAELDDFKFKQYLYNRNHQMNETLNTKTKLGFSGQARELTPDTDGKIYSGDYVQIGNEYIEGVLSFNINQSILGEQTYAVTASKTLKPALRNVFQIVQCGQTDGSGLKYGDKIRLEAVAGSKKIYLQSLGVSPMRSSKFSRQQEVSVTTNINANSLWILDHVDPKERFDCIGKQCYTSQPVLIRHCLTAQWLASDKVQYINDFGKQFEVYAKSVTTHNKTQNLFSEKSGHIDVNTPLRNQDSKNVWRIFKSRQ